MCVFLCVCPRVCVRVYVCVRVCVSMCMCTFVCIKIFKKSALPPASSPRLQPRVVRYSNTVTKTPATRSSLAVTAHHALVEISRPPALFHSKYLTYMIPLWGKPLGFYAISFISLLTGSFPFPSILLLPKGSHPRALGRVSFLFLHLTGCWQRPPTLMLHRVWALGWLLPLYSWLSHLIGPESQCQYAPGLRLITETVTAFSGALTSLSSCKGLQRCSLSLQLKVMCANLTSVSPDLLFITFMEKIYSVCLSLVS